MKPDNYRRKLQTTFIKEPDQSDVGKGTVFILTHLFHTGIHVKGHKVHCTTYRMRCSE